MTILSIISNLNLSTDELANLSDKDLVRIEKRLKAEGNLNNQITINDIESVITLLKVNKKELTRLYEPGLFEFRQLLIKPEPKNFTPSIKHKDSDESFITFINKYFSESLKTYITNCLNDNHFRSLHSFLYFRDLLSPELLEMISQGIAAKLEFGLEYHKITNQKKYTKANYLENPYFFRCINKLSPIQFESTVIDLVNFLIIKLKEYKNKYYHQITFAISFFETSRSDVKKYFKHLREQAEFKGVIEEDYGNSKNKTQRGGTINIYQESEINVVVVTILVFAVLFTIIVAINILKGDNSDTPKIEASNHILGDYTFSENVDSINYFQFTSDKLIKERNIPLDIDSFQAHDIGYFHDFTSDFFTKIADSLYQNDQSYHQVNTITNLLDDSLIVMTSGFGLKEFKCIPSHSSIVISKAISEIKIYPGKTPQAVSYLTKNNDTLSGFRFKTWPMKHQNIFNTSYSASNTSTNNTITITEVHEQILLHIKSH